MTRSTKEFRKFINQIKKEGEGWRIPTKEDRYFYDIYYYLFKNNYIKINDVDTMRNILDNSIVCPANTEVITKYNIDEYCYMSAAHPIVKDIKKNKCIQLLHYSDGQNIKQCDIIIPVGFYKSCKEQERDINRFLIKGAKWWDKINGNTYNSVIVKDLKTNKEYRLPYEYGYGNSFEYRAVQYIEENIVNYKLSYTNYNTLCVGYIKQRDCKNWNY